jgi:hypothetical protein
VLRRERTSESTPIVALRRERTSTGAPADTGCHVEEEEDV